MSCLTRFCDELEDLSKSVLARVLFFLVLIAFGIMLYYPVQCVIDSQQRTVHCIVFTAVVSGLLLLFLGVLLTLACRKKEKESPKPSRSSARAPTLPTIPEEEDFTATNPIRSSRSSW